MKTRADIIAEAKRVRDECLQIFDDADHWNRTHAHEKPIDADPDGELRRTLVYASAIVALNEDGLPNSRNHKAGRIQ